MNELFTSVKADLTDSRVRVVALALLAALVAAIAYAVLGGGSSKPAAPVASPLPTLPSLPGIAVTAAQPNPNAAVAETTSGAPKQHGGPSRNPFEPLPGSTASSTPSSSGAGSSKGSSSSSSSSSSGASSAPKSTHSESTHKGAPESSSPSGAGGAPAAAPTQPPKKQIVIHFHATAEFGVLPPAPAPGAPAPAPQLKTYKDMKLNEALPSKQNTQLVYLGVVLHTGKDAVFGLTGEAILHGQAKCVPSAAHCQAIELEPGQSETLESFQANGAPVTYQLKLLTISRTTSSASAARAHAAAVAWGKTKSRRSLLRRLGLAVAADARAARAAAGLMPTGSAFAALAGLHAR